MRFYAAAAAGASALLACAALLTSASPALAQSKPSSSVTATITLKHRKPSEIAALLADTSPSASPKKAARYAQVKLTANDLKNTLTARGGKQEVSLLRTLAASLDVAPKLLRLRVRLLRQAPAVGEADAPEAEELSKAIVKTSSATPADLTVFGDGQAFQVNLTPRVLRDGFIAVEYRLGVRSSPVAAVQKENTYSGNGRIHADETALRIGGNMLPRDNAAAVAGTKYYIEISPAE